MEKKKSSKKIKKIVVALILVVAIIAGVCYIVFKPEEKLKVETAKVSVQTISETLDTSGTVSAVSSDAFSLPNGVRVTNLNVKEGDIVEAGDVIATFDLSSLDESLATQKNSYIKAQEAYKNAQTTAAQAKVKVSEVEKQIKELETEIARLTEKSESAPGNSNNQAQVSPSLIKRFINIAKLFGVDYSEEEAGKFLSGIVNAGGSTNDLTKLFDNLGILAGSNGSFDFSALSGMTASSELMSAEMSLIQLKAQLATLQLQADDTYVATFKTIADKTEESYQLSKSQIDSMRNGWIAKDKGIVTEVNITKEGIPVNNQNGVAFDINTILSSVTTGVDVSSMLSSFLGQGQVAVKVLYYPLVADISLNKYDVLEVDLDQKVIIKPASGNELSGKVSYISAVASSSNGLNLGTIMGGTASSSVIPAQVTIEEADRSVIVGVDVQVSIITDTVENAVVVPVEVICIDGEDVFVYVLENGKAVKRNVELGISSDTYYQILSGLNKNDTLIKNTLGLEDGISVEAN